MNKLTIRHLQNLILMLLLLALAGCSDSTGLTRLSDDAVILTFGDSLTRGTGAKDPDSYPSVLSALTGRHVINAGIPGELSEDGLKRLPALLDEHQPALLILCHGGNDILRKKDLNRMGENLRAMIALAQERNIPVVLLGVPQPSIFLSSAEIYREIAESTGVVFIEDIIADVLGDKALKSDTVHPNGAGYRRIAEQVYSTLSDAGAI
jgi:acyl-CoA thioesterase-1